MIYCLVKVKEGAKLHIDGHIETWASQGGDEVWLAEKMKRGWFDCRKPGYGTKEEYGKGPAYVKGEDLYIHTPMVLLESSILGEYRKYHFSGEIK